MRRSDFILNYARSPDFIPTLLLATHEVPTLLLLVMHEVEKRIDSYNGGTVVRLVPKVMDSWGTMRNYIQYWGPIKIVLKFPYGNLQSCYQLPLISWVGDQRT